MSSAGAAAPSAIVLIGPMGAGKSSVGRRVAKDLGRRFVDSDTEFVKEHGPIADYFAAHGEPAFRAAEAATVRSVLEPGIVIALGGGAVLSEDTRALLLDHRVALLLVEPAVVRRRISGSVRPLLAVGGDPLAEWIRINTDRRPIYDEVADERFDTSHGPLSAVVTAIAAWARNGESE